MSLFLIPYNLLFHCIKLFDSIKEFATRGGENGRGESGATLKIAVNYLQIRNSQNLFCHGSGLFSLVVILHSEERRQKNTIYYPELFIQ